ncbi:MAG: S-methyl-5-thioribose-1-phosphate isomerase [Anaerolineae bacterium]
MRSVEWANGRVRLLDQRKLPYTVSYVEYDDYRGVANAITERVVVGPGAIGATAAYGIALAATQSAAMDMGSLLDFIEIAAVILRKADPNTPHLANCVDRMVRYARHDVHRDAREIRSSLLAEAHKIAESDIAANKRLGKYGASLIRSGDTVLVHASSGALDSVDFGVVLGIIRTAQSSGKRFTVLVTESRPSLSGALRTAWELQEERIPFTLIADAAAGYFIRRGEVSIIIIGANQVALNGDATAPIGAYSLSVLARESRVPFYVSAPLSLVDINLATGDNLPVFDHPLDELHTPNGMNLYPEHYPLRNPALDVIPQRYLAGIVTEAGIIAPPFRETLANAVARFTRAT